MASTGGASVERVDHRSIAVLGLVTICAYGAWYYSFGVLLDPIRLDTGWRESTLAASFSVGTVLVGLVSLAGGRWLDRVGHRWVFGAGAVIASSGLVLASVAGNVGVFVLGAALGLGASGALGFYHVTMATAVRLHPVESARAIATLTIWGAFASVIFLPFTAWLVDDLGWRPTVRVLAGLVFAAFVIGAIAVPDPPDDRTAESAAPRLSLKEVVAETVSTRETKLFTVAVAFGGIAMSTLLVYQVPAMTAAGLPATTAATMAGARGFAQLGGRLPLGRIVSWVGADRALVIAFVAIALGGALLAVSSSVLVAAAFAIVAGFGIGAFSPLQGMKSSELFDRAHLGSTMGFYGAVLVLAGSIGPVLAGGLADATGDRRWAAGLVAVSALVAAAAVKFAASDDVERTTVR